MRIRPLLAYAAVMLALTLAGPALASAQSAEAGSRHNKVFGYQDPETGVFHPLSTATPDVSTPATTGTIELVMTITLKTALPKGGAVLCGVDLTAFSENLSTYTISDWYEEAYTAATVSGSTATCTVNVPYSWVLPAASVLVTPHRACALHVWHLPVYHIDSLIGHDNKGHSGCRYLASPAVHRLMTPELPSM